MNREQEEVFCVRRDDLEALFGSPLPNGALKGPTIEDVLDLKTFFLPRSKAEHDPSYKQIIPYQLFRSDRVFFVYRRGEKIGEDRLIGRLSIGIGGHVNILDTCRPHDHTLSFYRDALIRERMEELSNPEVVREVFLGWINDESNTVGQVHLGAVHLCDVIRPEEIRTKTDEDIYFVGWWTKEEIKANKDLFESWSVFAVEFI
ncbi:MAG: phosphoesterase [Dissulfurimicrobium sp.]|uniref:phosphoesterase n=1 Tax=Dissulfurimicrobium TaxID=1769732 RepID=UPI001EDA2297|nr:phosphoesterase [Dissulfurimicrobium hydrothermale]UKL13226.1 phosphoesterase [Dissulfurimicrobium hydrothermale]